MANDYEPESLLNLNISGRRYSMRKSRAQEISGSLLDLLSRSESTVKKGQSIGIDNVYYFKETNEFFIERSPILFDIILQFAYTGHLIRNSCVCAQSVDEELIFWRLKEIHPLLPCCSLVIRNGLPGNHRRILNGNHSKKESNSSFIPHRRGISKLRRSLDSIWRFCEDPDSSRKALIFNLICILSIVISIGNLVIGTIPTFHHCKDTTSILKSDFEFDSDHFHVNISHDHSITTSNNETLVTTTPLPIKRHTGSKKLGEKFSTTCDGGFIFDVIELTCVVWFTIEFLLRIVSCPNRWSFIKKPLNLIDFLAIFPFYSEMVIWACGLITDLDRSTSVSSVLLMLRITRVLRAFRVLRLARYFDSLQLMGETLWESRRDMGLLAMFLAVGVLIFSTIMYYIEKDCEGTAYTSIPAAFWFAIVTLTTTGYGDVTPHTTVGKMVSGLACIAGVLIVAFPVSILVEHFRLSYATRRHAMANGEYSGHQAVSILAPLATTKRTYSPNSKRVEVLLEEEIADEDGIV